MGIYGLWAQTREMLQADPTDFIIIIFLGLDLLENKATSGVGG